MSDHDPRRRRLSALRRASRARATLALEAAGSAPAPAGSPERPRERLYGIPEIADLLDQQRGTVNAWYLRGTHAMPGPDQHVANVPVWFASTIEPWIELQLEAGDPEREAAFGEDLVRELAKRLFRLLALLLEGPERRPGLILRSSRELRELAPRLDRAVAEEPLAARRLGGLLSVIEELAELMPRFRVADGSYESVRLPARQDARLDEIRALLSEANVALARLFGEVEAGRERSPAEGRARRVHAPARAQQTPAIDRLQLRALVAAIPPGRWASYGDIAAALGRPRAAISVGVMIARDAGIDAAHRVLRSGGEVSPEFRTSEGRGPEAAAERLRADGVEVAGLRADPNRRMSREELTELALQIGSPLADPNG